MSPTASRIPRPVAARAEQRRLAPDDRGEQRTRHRGGGCRVGGDDRDHGVGRAGPARRGRGSGRAPRSRARPRRLARRRGGGRVHAADDRVPRRDVGGRRNLLTRRSIHVGWSRARPMEPRLRGRAVAHRVRGRRCHDRGAVPRHDDRAADAGGRTDRPAHRGQGRTCRVREQSHGQQRVDASARVQPHQSVGVQRRGRVFHTL